MVKPTRTQPVALDQARTARSGAGTKHPRQAFIAASPSVDTTVLREVLARRGIHAYQLDEVAGAGRSLTELLEESLSRADLVVAVLGNGGRENVLFELGFALGLKKRALLLVPPGEGSPVASIPFLRARPDNREALDFGLTQLLAAPEVPRGARDAAPPSTKVLGPAADELLRRLTAAGEQPSGQVLAELVHDALTASGILVMNQSPTRGSAAAARTDFAVWSADFDPWLGNPLLIEVRGWLADGAELRRALRSASIVLHQRSTAWGLLLYCGPDPGRDAATRPDPRILAMTVRGFLTALRDTSLGDLLKGLRDQRVRGRG